MFQNHKKVSAGIAIAVVVLLAALGIERIGGETWVSAAASAGAGWHARVGAYVPPASPVWRTLLVPLIMISAIVVVGVLGAILNRISNRQEEGATADRDR